jgi:RNA polymerase sigma factor (sigma-70 family)
MMEQDLFIKNMKYVKNIAKKLKMNFYCRVEINELVGESWIAFDKYIKKNPDKYESISSDIGLFSTIVRRDMYDYVRALEQSRLTQRMELKGYHFPTFSSIDYKDDETTELTASSCIHKDFEVVDNKDLLKELDRRSHLTDKEWQVIQGYFYDSKNLKEIGKEMGIKDNGVCNYKKFALDKYKEVAEELIL